MTPACSYCTLAGVRVLKTKQEGGPAHLISCHPDQGVVVWQGNWGGLKGAPLGVPPPFFFFKKGCLQHSINTHHHIQHAAQTGASKGQQTEAPSGGPPRHSAPATVQTVQARPTPRPFQENSTSVMVDKEDPQQMPARDK